MCVGSNKGLVAGSSAAWLMGTISGMNEFKPRFSHRTHYALLILTGYGSEASTRLETRTKESDVSAKTNPF